MVLLSKINPNIYITETIKYYCSKKYWQTDIQFIIELANHRDYWEYDLELLYMKDLYVLKDMAKYFFGLSATMGYSKAEKALKELSKR